MADDPKKKEPDKKPPAIQAAPVASSKPDPKATAEPRKCQLSHNDTDNKKD
jgi:hypothetical protein